MVSNLKNVETPWKNQLTALQGQDTVLSNLGTLFSSLSTDMSALTDFQGVLAQKTGSSSDTNVLELTSASTSATAGTHSVIVNNLAQTSSGYLAAISSASDTLSGSITMQVGSGSQKTITLSSSNNTLTGLASAINSSGVGVVANVLTDSSGSRLSLTSATSGARGNIEVISNSIADAQGSATTLTYKGAPTAGSGTLTGIANSSDALSGSITIQGQQIAVPNSPNDTLSGLMNAINTDQSGTGVQASIVTNSDGTSSLSLATTDGSALTVTSNVSDATLGYTSTVTAKDASLQVDGVNLTSSSNTVSGLIPGLTFQLLSASPKQSDGTLEPVQIVIGNDNTSIETAVNQFVTDYNSLISAINTQEGNDSTGTAEPLFGSPTLSLLQQQLLGGLNTNNPNGYLDAIPSTPGTTLADQSQITIQMGNGALGTFVVGAGSDSAQSGTYYTDNTDPGGVDNGNTLSGLAATINSASSDPQLTYSGQAGSSTTISNGTLSGIANENDTLTGSISIQVGDDTARTVTLDSSDDTLSGLMDAINKADIGVTATIAQDSETGLYSLSLQSGTSGSDGTLTVDSSILDTNTIRVTAGVATANGQSSLTVASGTVGTNGALTVTSTIAANTPAALSYVDSDGYTDNLPDSGTIGTVAESSDVLTGSLTIKVGNGAAQTIKLDSTDDTLAGLISTINTGGYGFTASGIPDDESPTSMKITSGTVGSAGSLTVTSNLFDTTVTTEGATLNYNNNSDIGSLTSLGISVNNDGTLTLDASTLDALLNTDFNGIVGLFQDANSWGMAFANMLNSAGTSSSAGVLKLAQNANSTMETNLNSSISKEEALIATQQKSLTAELNSANEILQELPSQLQGVNEIYSAISGYNQNQNG
jgi:flagellar hook-associated protein 2